MHFSLSASFNQQLSHLVLICICLTSYILWPTPHTWFYQVIYYSILIANLAFFGVHFYALKNWNYQCYLEEDGLGTIRNNANETQSFKFWRSPIVTVFAAVMFIEVNKGEGFKRQVFIVWSDMFDDNSYRNLCRQLLSWQYNL